MTAAKKPAKKPARKQPAAKKPAPARPPDTLAVDGSQLAEILDLAGATRLRKTPALLYLEKELGRRLPGELRTFMTRRLRMYHPDVALPDVPDDTFAGNLPNVPYWLDQLQQPTGGELLALQQLAGLYLFARRREGDGHLWLLTGIDPYGELDTGGVFAYDGRTLVARDPTLSGFLLGELHAHWTEHARSDGAELRDVFDFPRKHPGERPPAPAELPADVAPALDRRAAALAAQYDRIVALLRLLRGDVPHLPGLPTAAMWLAERDRVADEHAAAMYWLLAHWLFDNGPELADAVQRTRKHRSRLVAALREHVASRDAAAVYGPQQAALFAAVRQAATP